MISLITLPLKSIDVKGVDLPKRTDPNVVTLVESIREIGQLQPVLLDKKGRRLIAGRHRYVAHLVLGLKEIDAKLADLDDLGTELATIDENLVRRVLSALERGEQLLRRKELYEAMHPEARQGGAAGKKGGGKSKTGTVPGFARDTAAKTGESESSVYKHVQAVKKIDPEAKKLIAKTPAADSITELTKLTRLGPEKQREVARKVAADETGKTTVKAAVRDLNLAERVRETRAHVPPVGEYDVIVVDPPWQYDDTLDGSDAARGGTPYPTMTIAEIAALSLPVSKNCAVWLWVTNSHLVDPDAYAVVARAWRERYGLVARQPRTWRKTRMGLGRVLRNSTEHLVLLERGEPVYTDATLTTDFEAPVGEHSAKPQRAYDDIEAKCASTSRLEMFARAEREGWVTNGSELPKARMGSERGVPAEASDEHARLLAAGWEWAPNGYAKKFGDLFWFVEQLNGSGRWQANRPKQGDVRARSSGDFDTATAATEWIEAVAPGTAELAASTTIDDGTLCGIRPSKTGDGCIHKQGHEGLHSNGRTTWSMKNGKTRRENLRPRDVPGEAGA